MKQFTQQAKDYFDTHPSREECHITSDARVFHTKESAQSFAGTLDDQKIEKHSRKVLEKKTVIKKNHEQDIVKTAALIKLKTSLNS